MSNETREQENVLTGLPDAIDVDGERALWMAVLHQALHDASRTVRPRHWSRNRGQGGITRDEQEDACAFLSDLTRLGPICELLDIDAEWFQSHGWAISTRK